MPTRTLAEQGLPRVVVQHTGGKEHDHEQAASKEGDKSCQKGHVVVHANTVVCPRAMMICIQQTQLQ
jgi:hypothetical protein